MKSLPRLVLIIALVCVSIASSFGQKKKNIQYSGLFDTYYFRGPLTIDVGAGTPMYFGDLCSGFSCKKITPSGSIGVNYRWWPRLSFGGQFSYLLIAGTDIDTDRNITFKTSLFETVGYIKFFILERAVRRHSDMNKADFPIKPYITVGMGGAVYKATTENALSEGVSSPRISGMFPTGIGAQYRISKRVALSLEASYRWIFSDYIDGVSTVNGSDAKSDSYLTIEFKLNYSPFATRMKKKPLVIDKKASKNGGGGNSGDDAPAEETNDGGYQDDDSDEPATPVVTPTVEPEDTYNEPVEEDDSSDGYNNFDSGEETEETEDEDGYYTDDEEEEDVEEEDEDDGWGDSDDGW